MHLARRKATFILSMRINANPVPDRHEMLVCNTKTPDHQKHYSK